MIASLFRSQMHSRFKVSFVQDQEVDRVGSVCHDPDGA